MDEAPKRGPGRPRGTGSVNKKDLETKNELISGASIKTLAAVFQIHEQGVRDIILEARLEPCGERYGYPVYDVRAVAPLLTKPSEADIIRYIRKMSPKDLPVGLQAEFWKSQHARVKFAEDAEQLWSTARVQEALIEVFKLVRQQTLLLTDSLDQRADVTPAQRKAIQEIGDSLLLSIRDAIVEAFKNYKDDARDALLADALEGEAPMTLVQESETDDDGL